MTRRLFEIGSMNLPSIIGDDVHTLLLTWVNFNPIMDMKLHAK